MTLPPLDDLLDGMRVVTLPLRIRFRGVDHREAVLLRGPTGWGEFGPFLEYDTAESSRWLAAAIEAAWEGWPAPRRDRVAVNATLPVGLVMARAIRDYRDRTGVAIGFKPAGGIRTAKQALEYLFLMKEELGDRWLRPDLFRFGASALLTDIERQLEHFVTGRYSAAHRHPMV